MNKNGYINKNICKLNLNLISHIQVLKILYLIAIHIINQQCYNSKLQNREKYIKKVNYVNKYLYIFYHFYYIFVIYLLNNIHSASFTFWFSTNCLILLASCPVCPNAPALVGDIFLLTKLSQFRCCPTFALYLSTFLSQLIQVHCFFTNKASS